MLRRGYRLESPFQPVGAKTRKNTISETNRFARARMTNTSKQILWKRKKQSNLHTRLLILARTKQLHNVMLGVAHDVDFLVLLQFQSRQCLFQFSFTASTNGQHKNELNTHKRETTTTRKNKQFDVWANTVVERDSTIIFVLTLLSRRI
jgi:hypothetical protein